MARKASEDPKHRLQLVLSQKSMDRLVNLVLTTESESYAEVIRNALRLYEAVTKETETGGTFYLERDGIRTPVLTMR